MSRIFASLALLAALVGSASAQSPYLPGPPPQFGRLSNKELNRYTEQFGFTAV